MEWIKRITTLSVAALVSTTALQGAASAEVLTYVDADTTVVNDPNRGPTTTYGNDSILQVRWHEAPRVRLTYARFDISEIDPADYGDIMLAGNFTASSYNGSGTWNIYGLNDSQNEDDWDEATMNFTDAPGIDNNIDLGEFEVWASETELLGTITLDGVDEQPLGWQSNTTDLPLADFFTADTDGLVTFIIVSATQSGTEWRIDSKEASFTGAHADAAPMRLVVVPEPASLVLLGGAGLMLAARRRRA